MSLEARCVFDTSAAVSALLFEQSVPAQAFYAVPDRGQVLLSQATFTEPAEVLGRKKFDRYVSAEDRERFLARLLREARLVEITEEVRACRDPKDDKFLGLAVCGGASCVVAGDQDLLVLHPFRGVPILRPARFLESLAQQDMGSGA